MPANTTPIDQINTLKTITYDEFSLIALRCSNRGDAVFNAVVVIFAYIFLFQGLGALDNRITDVDFRDVACRHV